MMDASNAWMRQVQYVANCGEPARDTVEIMGLQCEWDMQYPLVMWEGRGVNYRFAVAEAAYIISGRNDTAYLTRAMKTFERFVNDGPYQAGAYGPPFVDQLDYVIKTLTKDPSSRQAVISIWRPRPYESKDIPCTLTLQFLIRNEKLHCVVNMRSSDVWRGLIYDMFCFSCMASVVAYVCGVRDLGRGFVHAGSSHLYDDSRQDVADMVRDPGEHQRGPKLVPMDAPSLFGILDAASDQEHSDEALDYIMSIFTEDDDEPGF